MPAVCGMEQNLFAPVSNFSSLSYRIILTFKSNVGTFARSRGVILTLIDCYTQQESKEKERDNFTKII